MCFQRKRQLATQMFFNRMFDIPCGKLHRVSLNRVSQFGGLVGSSWHHHLPPHLLLESASNKHITWTSYALFGPHVNPGLCNKYDCAHNLCAWAIYWLASTVMKAVARLTPLQHVELNSSAHFCKSKPVRTEWTRLPLKVKIYSALRCSNQTQPSLGALSISRQFAGQFLCIIARVYFDRIPHMVCQTSRWKTFVLQAASSFENTSKLPAQRFRLSEILHSDSASTFQSERTAHVRHCFCCGPCKPGRRHGPWLSARSQQLCFFFH